MTRRLAALALAAGSLGIMAAFSPASADPSLCVHASVTVNDTTQTVDQCVPPAK